MGVSLIPAVKAAFVAMLEEFSELVDVQISYGHPGLDALENESIWIGETDNWNQEWLTVGNVRMEETFELVVRFLASAPGQVSAEEAETRLFELFESVQALVRDQTNFAAIRADADSQLVSLTLVPSELNPFIGNEGRIGAIKATLRVKARI